MKTLLSLLLAFFVAIPTGTASDIFAFDLNEIKIAKVIKHLQPSLEPNQVKSIATIIRRNSVAIGVDWKIVVAILFQESSLKPDPQNCKVNFTRCNDMGIGQVRYSVWGKVLKIDRKRMVTDIPYALEKVFTVLDHYKKSYGHKELNWFTRYHHSDAEYRSIYMKKLNRAYALINSVKD